MYLDSERVWIFAFDVDFHQVGNIGADGAAPSKRNDA